MPSGFLPSLLFAGLAAAGGWGGGRHHHHPPHPGNGHQSWQLSQFNSFVTFGDSYTDENRLNYFASHNEQPPPPGTVLPESYQTASGGRDWPRYVVQYAGSKSNNGTWDPRMTLYNYAVSGGVCSNELTPRIFIPPSFDFPSVREYELPAFKADLSATNPATGKPTFSPPLTALNAVYAIWIGTNDLGADAFFTDSQVPGTDIVDYLDCVYEVLDGLHDLGARYFVIMNAAPLYLAPLYANASEGGISPAEAQNYWPNKTSNLTEISQKMEKYVSLVNDAYDHRTPYERLITNRYPQSNMALFRVHDLMYDIHQNPAKYLNGSAPLVVTAGSKQCSATNSSDCTLSPSPDSYLWFDSLHPSEQTDRVIAREFINVLNGNSTFTSYW